MDDKVYKLISDNLGISQQIVEKVVAMLNDGATIPFISRYRKEATNNLDELAILDIQTQYNKFKEIVERKKYIIETLTKQERLRETAENAYNYAIKEHTWAHRADELHRDLLQFL